MGVTMDTEIERTRDPANEYDPNAICCTTSDGGLLLGYLPRGRAAHLSPMLDSDLICIESCLRKESPLSMEAKHLTIRIVYGSLLDTCLELELL